ncbi:MAG: TnsA-like heteromeric transposase endonuclease subunit [Trebonia sp.]
MVLRQDRHPYRVRILAGAGPSHAHGLRSGSAGGRVAVVLAPLAGQGRSRRHAPDFFARRHDGSAVVIDVRPDDRIPDRDAQAFAVTAEACEAAGWEYRRSGDLDPVLVTNVRWLSRYRHQRCLVPEVAAALLDAFAGGRGLFEGAELAGDRLRVLPVLFHLMWQRQLSADLTVPLGVATPSCTRAGPGERRPPATGLDRRPDPGLRQAEHHRDPGPDG